MSTIKVYHKFDLICNSILFSSRQIKMRFPLNSVFLPLRNHSLVSSIQHIVNVFRLHRTPSGNLLQLISQSEAKSSISRIQLMCLNEVYSLRLHTHTHRKRNGKIKVEKKMFHMKTHYNSWSKWHSWILVSSGSMAKMSHSTDISFVKSWWYYNGTIFIWHVVISNTVNKSLIAGILEKW